MKTAASNLFIGQGRDIYQAILNTLDQRSDKRQHGFVDYVEK